MSDNVTATVPVLDGNNWVSWSETMEAFLSSKGLWRIVSRVDRPEPISPREGSDGSICNQDDIDARQTKIDNWDDDNERAMGTIRLRLTPTITQVIKGETTAKAMWKALSDSHQQATLSNAYVEFKSLLELRFPEDNSPANAIAKWRSHLDRLSTFHVKMSPYVLMMLILSKTSAYAASMAQLGALSQKMVDLDDTTSTRPDYEGLLTMIQLTWDQRKLRSKVKSDHAQRTSGIKHKGQDPQFKAQQDPKSQPQGSSNQQQPEQGEKKKRRGKRGSKKQGDGAPPHNHSHLASAAVTNTFAPPPPKSLDPKPSLASRLETDRPSHRDTNNYPRLRRALNLLERLDVPKGFESVRTLEEVVDAAEHARHASKTFVEEKDVEPQFIEGSSSRPLKRARIDWAEEMEEFDAEPAVSLDGSEDEKSTDSNVDDDILASIGYYDAYVHPDLTDEHSTKGAFTATTLTWTDPVCSPIVLNTLKYNVVNALNRCEHNASYDACQRCKGKSHFQTWMLDSGASFHFTHKLKLLNNVRKLSDPVPIMTANGLVHVDQVGDATLDYLHYPTLKMRKFLLQNVHYMPTNADINLVSLGTLMQQGMTFEGQQDHIILYKNKDEVMRFTPMFPGATVFRLLSGKDKTVPVAVDSVSHDIVHRRFAHPGDKVLRRFPSQTIGCPEFSSEPSKSPCPGCAQGKMPSRSFPPNPRRATKPFELIHSDLKSFPVLSYHRYEYVITFFDDYTSHAWITFLRKKSAAISATRQFLAMVDTQYHTKVEQWMSDARGEYKSDAFDELLKGSGIKILTSVPHTPQ